MRLRRLLSTLRMRLRSVFHRARVEQELDDEIRDHLDRRIAAEVPIAVIDRPPQSFRALAAPAAQALARYRLPENQAARLTDQQAPAWVFLTRMKLNLSSTGLRNPDGSWKAKK